MKKENKEVLEVFLTLILCFTLYIGSIILLSKITSYLLKLWIL